VKRLIAMSIIVVMTIAAIPTNTTADWVEPVPGTETDDEFMHVTYDFQDFWKESFEAYEPGSSNREPWLTTYDDKLWVLWEGLLVPNSPLDPVAYKGKIYARSYTDHNGEPEWGDIIDITPNAYYQDHVNQKVQAVEFKGKMYVIWQSGDRNLKPQGHPEWQWDIMVRSYDGNEMNEFSPPEIISRHGAFAGEGGFEQYPQVVVYQDKLFVVWFREDTENGITDILYRTFDGNAWSDINVLSAYPNNNTDNLWPSLSVWKNRLYVLWQKEVKGSRFTEAVHSYTADGKTWSPVTPISRKMDTTRASFDTVSNLATYQNPKTDKLELHAFWRTFNTENTHGGPYDYDIVTKVFDGDDWGPTKEISPKDDKWDDTYPFAIEIGGELHIFWSSKDNNVGDGEDYDIIRRTYDGESYSEPETISRVGDRDVVLFDDNEWWNEGDDQWSKAVIYPNQYGDERLFLVWWTFDHITGCCYDNPTGAHPTIAMKLVEDADHDKDGYPDSNDDCPNDPEDHRDSDGDSYCDNNDGAPNDPTKWKIKTEPIDDRANWDPLPMYMIIIVLLIACVALLAARGSKKKPRPSKPKKRSKVTEEE